jgi:hypothetical protein
MNFTGRDYERKHGLIQVLFKLERPICCQLVKNTTRPAGNATKFADQATLSVVRANGWERSFRQHPKVVEVRPNCRVFRPAARVISSAAWVFYAAVGVLRPGDKVLRAAVWVFSFAVWVVGAAVWVFCAAIWVLRAAV